MVARHILRRAGVLMAATSMLATSYAQTDPTIHAMAGKAPTAVPTTKILAIGHLTAKADRASLVRVLPGEVSDTVRVYLQGKIDQWYTRNDQTGVVFVLNVQDMNEAREVLEKLPLGRAGLMEFDFIPIGPLAPLGLLAGPAAADNR